MWRITFQKTKKKVSFLQYKEVFALADDSFEFEKITPKQYTQFFAT